MALAHAAPGEVVDLRTWGSELPPGKSKAIVKTDELELLRLALAAGKELPSHETARSIVIQCLEGAVELRIDGHTKTIRAGQLLHLGPQTFRSLKAVEDSSLLMTFLR